MRIMSFAARLSALALAASPAVAAPEGGPACIDRRQVEDIVIFALPTALDVAGAACANALPRGAVLADRSTAARYRAEADAAWASNRDLVGRYGGNKGIGSLLGPDGLRSIVTDLIAKQVGQAIKPGACGALDRLVEGFGPLPARGVAQILVAMAELSGKEDRLPIKPCQAAAVGPR